MREGTWSCINSFVLALFISKNLSVSSPEDWSLKEAPVKQCCVAVCLPHITRRSTLKGTTVLNPHCTGKRGDLSIVHSANRATETTGLISV